MKNVKRIFFVLTLITLLLAVSTVSAVDNDTTDVVSQTPVTVTDASNDVISTEQVQTSSENIVTDTRNELKKEEKQIKTSTQTVDVNDYDELKTAINNAVNDPAYNEEYIFNLNEGTYILNANALFNSGTNTPNIIINANGQTLSSSKQTQFVRFNNGCNITINDAIITHRLQNYITNLTLNNVTINEQITNRADKTLTFINSTINCSISNNGNIIIDENSIIGENLNITADSNVYTNNTGYYEFLEQKGTFYYNKIFENTTLEFDKIDNFANLTIINSIINLGYWTSSYGMEYYSIGTFTNNGNLTIINCTLNCTISNTGNMIIDKCLIPSSGLGNQGNLTISNVEWDGLIGMTLSQNNIPSNTVIINSSFKNNPNNFITSSAGADLEVYNSTFSNQTRAMTGADNLIIDNCNFTNSIYNTRLVSGVNASVTNSKFINNKVTNGYGTLRFSNGNVTNCEFINNSMTANDAWNIYNGIAISATGTVYDDIVNISNNIFENNQIDAIEGQVLEYDQHDYHTNGYGTIVIQTVENTFITNNTFTNCSTNQKAAAIYLEDINKYIPDNSTQKAEIYNNTFNNMKSTSETIIYEKSKPYINNPDITFGDIYIHDNIYNNSTIDFDNLIVIDPLKVFTGDEITLKANTQLLNPEFYDEDILNQTRYNWYIAGENIITDSPEYTITVPEDTMIIYVTPTITNTRSKLLVLNPNMVTDKIITPENINKNLFEGELIGIQANTRLLFQGDFTNLGEIY